jgi:hypothetical protein
MKKSIFSKIVDAIDSINLKSKSINEKCVKVCESIFNNFCYNGGDFHLYKSFSNDFFKSIISSNRDRHIVLEILKGSEILLCDESYNVDRGIGKGYKFNSDCLNPESEFKVVSFKRGNIKEETLKSCSNFLFLESKEQFNYSIQSKSIINNLNNSTISLLLPHFETYINQGLQSADFDEKVYEWIKNYEVKRDSIKVNDEITDEYINLKLGTEKTRYSTETAVKFATEQDLSLIQYKDTCYIDNIEDFIKRKSNDIKIIFRKSIFDIKN